MFNKLFIVFFISFNQLICSSESLLINRFIQKPDQTVSFKEISELSFLSSNQTKAGINQIDCYDKLNELCKRFNDSVRDAKCKNKNFKKLDYPEWDCKFLREGNYSKTIQIESYNITCDPQQQDEVANFKQTNNCYLRYHLKINEEIVKSYKQTEYMTFDLNKTTSETDPNPQLRCFEVKNLIKHPCACSFDEQTKKCRNSRFRIFNDPKWECDFKAPEADITIRYEVRCDPLSYYPFDKFYLKDSCVLFVYLIKDDDNQKKRIVIKIPDTSYLRIIVKLGFILLFSVISAFIYHCRSKKSSDDQVKL